MHKKLFNCFAYHQFVLAGVKQLQTLLYILQSNTVVSFFRVDAHFGMDAVMHIKKQL